jgi:hypothetical protein
VKNDVDSCQEQGRKREFLTQKLATMKNRYCARTKLSEDTFLLIVSGFCAGLTATETRATILEQNLKVSRQAVEEKFLELGQYFYRKWVASRLIQLMREANTHCPWELPDQELESAALYYLWKTVRGDLPYEGFRKHNMEYPGPPELIDTLKKRWISFKGFPPDTFKGHVAFALYTINPRVKNDQDRAYQFVVKTLERDPLGANEESGQKNDPSVTVAQNRYCRDRQVTEETFICIVAAFCGGRTAVDTYNEMNALGIRITSQIIETKFSELGVYFYTTWFLHPMIKLMREANAGVESQFKDEVIEFIFLTQAWDVMRDEFDKADYPKLTMPASCAALYPVLRQRWKDFGGFDKKTFREHLGFANYFCHAFVESDAEFSLRVVLATLLRNPL